MKQLKYLVGLGVSVALSPPLSAANHTSSENMANEIAILKREINQLDKEVKALKTTTRTSVTHSPENTAICTDPAHCTVVHSAQISMGSYLDRDTLFDGSDLLVQLPGVREDVRILLQEANVIAECQSLHIPTPPIPRLVFSGKLEGQMSFLRNYQNTNTSNINFTGAELATYVKTSDFISGYLTLDYDPSAPGNQSQIFMNRAFIIFGNLKSFPIYSSVGQLYTAFGRYNSGMVSSPVTLSLGRTRARALTLGYQEQGSNALHAEAYIYQGLTTPVGQTNARNEYGAGTGYTFKFKRFSGEIGASYISNLGDSQGLQSTIFLNDQTQQNTVPAINVYGALAFNPFVFLAEYVAATKQFSIYDMSFQNHGAKPKALHLEADYNFKTASRPSSVGVAYGHTAQALDASLPQDQYSVFYNINIFKATNFAIEYRHDVNYKNSAATTNSANPTPTSVTEDLGKDDNVITAQFDLFF